MQLKQAFNEISSPDSVKFHDITYACKLYSQQHTHFMSVSYSEQIEKVVELKDISLFGLFGWVRISFVYNPVSYSANML